MLNADFKIISKLLANRLNGVLPTIIQEDQRGFVSGRDIAENAVELQDVLDYVEREKLDFVLLNLDFKKAFDTVDWGFMIHALESFGFPPYILNLTRALHAGASTRIIHGDKLSLPCEI